MEIGGAIRFSFEASKIIRVCLRVLTVELVGLELRTRKKTLQNQLHSGLGVHATLLQILNPV